MEGWSRRPALDGLRAVALAMVLLSHAGVGFVGGAIGVDVFLVLSGYLITGLLLVELDRTGRIDLRAFWSRRARRLLPAALVLVGVVAVLGAADRLDTVAALGWWSNWRFALADAGYFASFGAPSPLRHTWSLAVEEQWYLLWPPLLLGLTRLGRWRLAAAAALTVASAATMWALAADVDRAHMGTDTRAQGLLAGAVVAMALHGRPTSTLPRRATTVAGVAGAAVLVAIAWRVPGTEPWLYRGGHLVVAAASAAVVVACLRVDGPLRTVLAARPLQAIGRVSYGAYLWHWPLFVWLTPDRTGLDPWPLLVVRVAATAAATLLSWHLVERPVLDGRPLPRPRHAWRPALAGAAAVVVLTAAADPAAHRAASSSISAAAQPAVPAGFTEELVPPSTAPTAPGVLDTLPAPRPIEGDPVVTITGDSTGLMLGWDVEPIAGVEVHDGASLGCGIDPADMVIGDTIRHEEGYPVPCTRAVELWRWWVTTTSPDLVVLAMGAWEVYDRELADGTRVDVGTAAWARWVEDGIVRVAADLAAAAPHARIAITDVPCYDERDLGLGGPASARNDPARRAAVNAVIERVVARHPARLLVLPWTPWLCGPDAIPRADGVHLEPPAARALWAGPLGEWVRSTVGAPS